MPVRSAFVDTNIWLYAHLRSPGDPRHERALERIRVEPAMVISPQVVGEYVVVMVRNKRPEAWITTNLRAIFAHTKLQPVDAAVVNATLALRKRYGFSYWDSQIVAAALASECDRLLSDDLQHGQRIDDRLQIVNPLV